MDYGRVFQGIVDLKGSVSKLEQQVIYLEKSFDEQKAEIRAVRKTLDGVKKILWTGTAIFLIVSTIAGILAPKLVEVAMGLSDLLRHPPQAQSVSTEKVVPPPGYTLDPTPAPPGSAPKKRPPLSSYERR